MAYWLAKSEPDCYSIDDMQRDKQTLWDGVRNYQARNFLRDQWKVGDQVLFYHSSSDPAGVAGICVVSKEKVPDPTQFDPKSDHFDPVSKKDEPRWYAPQVKFEKKFSQLIELSELRKVRELKSMQLLQRGNRLSVLPVTKAEFAAILKLVS